MIRMIYLFVVLGILLGLTGCSDPAPGEISVIARKNGQTQSCAILLYNESGIQLNLVPTDINGLVYIKKLAPGTYTLKFQDVSSKTMYPAVKTVTVTSNDTNVCRVELNEAPPIEGEE